MLELEAAAAAAEFCFNLGYWFFFIVGTVLLFWMEIDKHL